MKRNRKSTLPPGTKINHWTLLELTQQCNTQGRRKWRVRCDCGAELVKPISNIRQNQFCAQCRMKERYGPVDLDKARRLRMRGEPWAVVESSVGRSQASLRSKLQLDYGRFTWAYRPRNMKAVEKLRAAGLSWEEVKAQLSAPYANGAALNQAYLRARCRRMVEHWEKQLASKAYKAVSMTQCGMSAGEIARLLGASERQVVRWRKKTFDFPHLDTARIQKLADRGVDWREINKRLGMPYGSGEELETAYHYQLGREAEEPEYGTAKNIA